MKFPVAILVALLSSEALALTLNTRLNSRLHSANQFSFSNFLDNAGDHLQNLAGGDSNLVQGIAQQASKIHDAAESGNVSDIVNAGTQFASQIGGDRGVQIGQIGQQAADVMQMNQNGNVSGALANSLSLIGQRAGGADG